MYKDREWADFRHFETFSKKIYDMIFVPAAPPGQMNFTRGLIMTPAVKYNASGYRCDLTLCKKILQ